MDGYDYVFLFITFLINCSVLHWSPFLIKRSVTKVRGNSPLPPLKIRCFNQVADGLISSGWYYGADRVAPLSRVSDSICASVSKGVTVSFMSGECGDILSHPNFRCSGVEGAKHQSVDLCRQGANTDAHSVLLWKDADPVVHAPAWTSHD